MEEDLGIWHVIDMMTIGDALDIPSVFFVSCSRRSYGLDNHEARKASHK